MPGPLGTFVAPPLINQPGQMTLPEQAAFQQHLGLLGQMLSGLDQQQPLQVPVPGSVSPLAQMAAAFAGSLASQTGTPGAYQAIQGQIQQAQQAQQQAEQQNLALMVQDQKAKQAERLKLLLDIGETKLDMYKRTGDIQRAEQQLKAQHNYALKLEKLKQENEMAQIAARGEQQRQTKATPPAPSPKGTGEGPPLKTTEAKNVAQMAADIWNNDNYADWKGEHSFLGMGGGNPRRVLKPEGKALLKSTMLPLIRTGPPAVRQDALGQYLEAYRGEDGAIHIAPGSEEDKTIGRLLQMAIPDPGQWQQFLIDHGVVSQ